MGISPPDTVLYTLHILVLCVFVLNSWVKENEKVDWSLHNLVVACKLHEIVCNF